MLKIRDGLHSDVGVIRKIMETAHDTLKDKSWYYIKGTTEEWLHNHVNEDGFTLVAENDTGEVVAFLCVHYPSAIDHGADANLGQYIEGKNIPASEVAHMDTCAVMPKYRGNGLQSKLVSLAETKLSPNIKYCMCTVHPDNIPSCNSMTRIGYTVISNVYDKYEFDVPRYVMLKERA